MMRCEEVIRELAVPTEGRDDPAISRHLADCKACARRAEQAAEFDRVWDATRPAEPSADAWDNLWSSVTAQLDQPTHSTVNGTRSVRSPAMVSVDSPVSSVRGRYWRGLAAVGMIGLAQAAALLIAVGVAWHVPVKAPSMPRSVAVPTVAQNTRPSLDSVIEVEEGEPVLIHWDGKELRVERLAAQDSSNGVDELSLFLNVLEPMAKSVVAMTE